MVTTSRGDIILSTVARAALGIQIVVASCATRIPCWHSLRHWAVVLCGTVWLMAFASPGFAQTNVVVDVNNALLRIITNTSASLVSGPPQVAREIAFVDGAMFDAVNAASGCPYRFVAYQGNCVSGADPKAAALKAALTVMNAFYISPSSLYQQYQGVTGATYYPSIPGYAGVLVGPTTTQMTEVARQISIINAELTALNPSWTSLSLGTAAGNAMIAFSSSSGGYAARLQTMTPFIPAYVGQAGVYVPPSNRPAMMPTWGSVMPIGISSQELSVIETAVPVADAATSAGLASQEYALQVLQTECTGAGVGLPSNVAGVCRAAGFAPATAAQSQSALFWNDPGGSLQPPGHWLQIADTIAAQNRLSLLQTARATAVVGLALQAAGIAAWDIKYRDLAWRPITAIQFSSSWNQYFTAFDPSWRSLIATPPHPDYVAGHPAFSGAAATALAEILYANGIDHVTFTSTSATYCNSGQTARNSLGNVISCTLNGVTYAMPTVCANGGTAVYDGDPAWPILAGCTLNGVPQSVTGGGCNNAGSQPVLNPDYTANALYNASPLICVIAATYSSLSQAAYDAKLSRVVGGIHTPSAVTQALTLGNSIGDLVGDSY
jgi:hypothetical protein